MKSSLKLSRIKYILPLFVLIFVVVVIVVLGFQASVSILKRQVEKSGMQMVQSIGEEVEQVLRVGKNMASIASQTFASAGWQDDSQESTMRKLDYLTILLSLMNRNLKLTVQSMYVVDEYGRYAVDRQGVVAANTVDLDEVLVILERSPNEWHYCALQEEDGEPGTIVIGKYDSITKVYVTASIELQMIQNYLFDVAGDFRLFLMDGGTMLASSLQTLQGEEYHALSQFTSAGWKELIQMSSSGFASRKIGDYRYMVISYPVSGNWYVSCLVQEQTFYQSGQSLNQLQLVISFMLSIVVTILYIRATMQRIYAEEASRKKSNFLMNMSHAVRTPMNAIVGFAKLIGKRTVSREGRIYLQIVDQSSKQLLRIIDQVVELSEIQDNSGGEYAVKSTGVVKEGRDRVLVVDDNYQNLVVAEELIKLYGVEVVTAESGVEALRILRNDASYHLILLDYMMPEMDGIRVAESIRRWNDEYFRTLPIVALTANTTLGIEDKFRQAGMNGMLSKPIDLDKLDEVMHLFLPSVKRKADQEDGRSKEENSQMMDPHHVLRSAGIQIRSGLNYMAGNIEQYRRVLAVFEEAYETKRQKMEEYLEQKDYDNYNILVHALKSNAKSIGADILSQLAFVQEKASADRDVMTIASEWDTMMVEWDRICKAIRRYLEQDGTKAQVQASNGLVLGNTKFIDGLRDMIQLLDEFEKKEVLHRLQAMLEYSMEDQKRLFLQKLEKVISAFEYEEAIRMMNEYIKRGDGE